MDGLSYFSASYREARQRFLTACETADHPVVSLRHPLAGPQGEELAMDMAWLGPPDAKAVLVSASATHGVEGYCGSAVQLGWLESGLYRERPAGVAHLLVHAVNPYGFAWTRRTNEQNVDLNRNFIDFQCPLPENPGYDVLADLLCPSDPDPARLAETHKALEAFEAEQGLDAFMDILLGQYRHPQGLFYGGLGKTWSNQNLVSWLKERLPAARQVALIDIHTGYGPYGYGDPMSSHGMGDPADRRVRDWYGADISTEGDGDRVFPQNFGDLANALVEAAPQAAQASITLEFGTRSDWDVFDALRHENWLHHHGPSDSPDGPAIKEKLRDAFYPEEDTWKGKVWERAVEVHLKALRGLAET